jgi:hypothetical protein
MGPLALALAAGPVAAAAPIQSSWSETYTVQHDCGVMESTTVTVRERAYFEGSTWVRSALQLRFDGVYTGPTGKTFEVVNHQNAVFTPDTGQLSGQGTFLHGAGGVLVMDVGHLVFDLASGMTIQASAQALGFDDPIFPDLVEAALCAQLG